MEHAAGHFKLSPTRRQALRAYAVEDLRLADQGVAEAPADQGLAVAPAKEPLAEAPANQVGTAVSLAAAEAAMVAPVPLAASPCPSS